MEAKAITRHIRQSPRKIRILLDDLRGSNVDKAMNYLHFSKAKAAYQIEKTLSSAVANLMNSTDTEDISVENIYVPDPGAGEVVVDIQACGVCHTDLHYR